MTELAYHYKCPVMGTLMISPDGCTARGKKAGPEYDCCRGCPGPEPLAQPRPVGSVTPPRDAAKRPEPMSAREDRAEARPAPSRRPRLRKAELAQRLGSLLRARNGLLQDARLGDDPTLVRVLAQDVQDLADLLVRLVGG